MIERKAKVLQHKMYQHIHDDKVACAKCEAKGYLEAIMKGDRIKNRLIEMKERIDEGYYTEDGGIILDWIYDDIKDVLNNWEKDK